MLSVSTRHRAVSCFHCLLSAATIAAKVRNLGLPTPLNVVNSNKLWGSQIHMPKISLSLQWNLQIKLNLMRSSRDLLHLDKYRWVFFTRQTSFPILLLLNSDHFKRLCIRRTISLECTLNFSPHNRRQIETSCSGAAANNLSTASDLVKLEFSRTSFVVEAKYLA